MTLDSKLTVTTLQEAEARIHKLEAQLKESQQMLQTILDSIPAYVFWRDMELRMLGCNQQYAHIAGFQSPEQLIGKTDFDVAQPEFAEKYQADDRSVIESGKARLNFEEEGVSPDGSPQWFRTSKMPLHDAEGKTIGILGFFQDITDQKLAAVERDRLQQQVIEAQQLAIQELSSPIIPLMNRILVMPLVGGIDTVRASEIMRAMLRGITEYRAEVIILDITGVPVVDSGVADHLNRTIQAARLKGARTIITGVSDAVAETIVDLGIDWTNVETLRDLESGLFTALERLGYRLNKVSPSKN